VALGFAAAAWNYFFGGQDKDKRAFHDKLPEYTRSKALMLFAGGTDKGPDGDDRPLPIILPIPFNYAFASTLGQSLAGVLFGTEQFPKIGANVISSFISAFSEIGEQRTLWRDLAPELIRPFMDLAQNKSWSGGHIHIPEDFQTKPNSETGARWTPGFWKDIAKFLNQWTGGSHAKAGYLDFHPEDLEYVAKEYLGGQVRLIEGAAKAIQESESDKEGKGLKASDIPVSKVFYGTDYDKTNHAIAREKEIEGKRTWLPHTTRPREPLIDLGLAK
jgi:Large polyvalent protein associated domain 38